jgi:hypothetical protein
MKKPRLSEIAPLLGKYQNKGLLLDSNLLLLLFAGQLGATVIEEFKPTRNQGFLEKDYEMLAAIVSAFKKVVTTPHILAEVSNHADQAKGLLHPKMFNQIRRFIGLAKEEWIEAENLCNQEHFLKFGVTDTAVSELAPGRLLIMTVDFPLCGYLASRKIDAINFNHLRPIAWTGF